VDKYSLEMRLRTNMAPLTNDDKVLIKSLRLEKDWSALRMISRKWKRSTLCDLIKRIDETGETDRQIGSGRPRSACSNASSEHPNC